MPIKMKVLLIIFVASSIVGAPIAWEAPVATSGKHQLIEGEPVLLLNGAPPQSSISIESGGASGSQTYDFVTANFKSINDFTPHEFAPTGESVADVVGGAYLSSVYGSIPIDTTGDEQFDGLIKSLIYAPGNPSEIATGKIIINDLVIGNNYKVQVFYNDQRAVIDGRIMRLGDEFGSTAELIAGYPDWGVQADHYGSHVIGYFTATETHQDITLEAVGFGAIHCNAILVTADGDSTPLASISTSSFIVEKAFAIEVDFSEPISGLQEDDFEITNGSIVADSLSFDGSVWTAMVQPSANGDVHIVLPGGAVGDIDGDSNFNRVSNTLIVTMIAPDSDRPEVTVSSDEVRATGPFQIDIIFSEAIAGLQGSMFSVSNGYIGELSGADDVYTALVTPIADGAVELFLAENQVYDIDGDQLQNTESNTFSIEYAEPDIPTVLLYGDSETSEISFPVYLTFSETVTGLDSSDFDLKNGTATDVQGGGKYFSVKITALTPGPVSITLKENSIVDTDLDQFGNPASEVFTVTTTTDFDQTWVIKNSSEWIDATGFSNGLVFESGQMIPNAEVAHFRSVIQTYPTLKKPKWLTVTQSSAWNNWTQVPNVGPSGAGDAPVLLSIAEGDYYLLGRGYTGGYHAWHSTDMENWTDHGAITSSTYPWVTTAEYKDGLFYIYYDHPNDSEPHLYIDSDLKDGIPGENYGIVLRKPTPGSDCSIIRNDTDGLFHLIYEDWSSINAGTASWDSPYAGHASSPDGKTGFTPHEHKPSVDHRTTPTGIIESYIHPFIGPCTFELHNPRQNAFGDWTTIKVGSRFYLFGDYHDHVTGIQLARFTSESIYEEFELIGSLPSGHPDPTVAFAEGKFYLLTQKTTDFVSSGPWVDGVEARAGVDSDGDLLIDVWTDWQTVAEQYSHKPGYARVVDRVPARIDLSSLPEGYAFQFELRIDDTVIPDFSPIIDSVAMTFEPSYFRQWASANHIPANAEADFNHNGVQDLIEFVTGTVAPIDFEGSQISYPIKNVAIADGYSAQLLASTNLKDWGLAADYFNLIDTVIDESGDMRIIFQYETSDDPIFIRLYVEE